MGLFDIHIVGEGHVGGLVGRNWGSISQSYSTGSVKGNEQVGGLVGEDIGSTIDQSFKVDPIVKTRIAYDLRYGSPLSLMACG